MKASLFDYKDYKIYLKHRIQKESKAQRGHQRKLAEVIRLSPSYLSQVLHGKPQLTLEQALLINNFYLHDKVEAKFFILLVEKSRAGSRELENYFNEQMLELLHQRFNLKQRLKDTKDVPLEMQHKYYSTWYYSAVHIGLAIPDLQNLDLMAERLHLSKALIVEAIKFLEECGLIEITQKGYAHLNTRFHLARNSDFIRRHHINWRIQALQSIERGLETDFHYSLVFALTKEDKVRIQEVLLEAIENSRKIIAPSPSEELCALTLDLFTL